MYLTFIENNVSFCVEIEYVKKVVDINAIIQSQEGYFYNSLPVKVINLVETLDIKFGNENVKRKAILLHEVKDVIPTFFVNDVAGFIKKETVVVLKKQDYLNFYGFWGIKEFCLKDNILFFCIDSAKILAKIGIANGKIKIP
jgi:hypothetical protein